MIKDIIEWDENMKSKIWFLFAFIMSFVLLGFFPYYVLSHSNAPIDMVFMSGLILFYLFGIVWIYFGYKFLENGEGSENGE